MTCYYCDTELTKDNQSKEHIIPDALGGKGFYSFDLLCQKCNKNLGSTVDHDLEEQVVFYADLINVPRDRKKEKLITGLTSQGEKIAYGRGLIPKYEFNFEYPKGNIIKLFGDSEKDIIKIIRKKLTELKRKDNSIDIEKELAGLRKEIRNGLIVYFTNKFSIDYNKFVVGKSPFFRGVTKIAINYYLLNGGTKSHIQIPIEYLKGDYPSPIIADFYYPRHYSIHQVEENEISHLIYLKGDANEGILYCYVELFNAHNSLVILNPFYNGENIEATYCYDYISKTKVNKEITFKMNKYVLTSFPFDHDPTTSQRHQVKSKILMKKIENLQEKFI